MSRLRPRSALGLLWFAWITFIAAGVFFAVLTPLGEGFDEPPHFAYIQYLAQEGKVPLGHSTFPSVEVDRFLQSHPVGLAAHEINFPAPTYDEYWTLPASERAQIDAVLINLRFSKRYIEVPNPIGGAPYGGTQYESHQPPLYYLTAVPIFELASRTLSFIDTFLLMRLWSVLLSSLIVPATFLLARAVFGDIRACDAALLLVVLFPGIYSSTMRVSNDALTMPLAGFCCFFLIQHLKSDRDRDLFGLAALIVAGMWTKAFFLPILAGAVVSLLLYKKVRSAAILTAVSTLGVPWYLFVFSHTGSMTGLPESVSARTSVISSVRTLLQLDWKNLLTVIRFSHIWIGNRSLLGVRSWMYQVIFWLFLLGLIGLIRKPRSLAGRTILPLVVVYAIFMAGLVYFATEMFQAKGTSVAQGWYLNFVVPLEAVLFVAGARTWLGLKWSWLVAPLSFFLIALLVYSAVFVMFPYYSGITAHDQSGRLAVYVPSLQDFHLMASRLLRYHPWIPVPFPFLFFPIILSFAAYGMFCLRSQGTSAAARSAIPR